MTPAVSVVMPLYNKRRSVLRAVQSVLQQSFPDLELLVVDDGSTDGSAALLDGQTDPRLRVIQQTNAGPGAARNAGLRAARAPRVAFLDADDEWLPEFLSQANKALDASAVRCYTASYREGDDAARIASMWQQRGLQAGVQRVTATTPALQLQHLCAFLTPCTTLADRTMLLQYGGFFDRQRCRYGEDAFLWFRVLLNESVCIDLQPLAIIHRELSDLSALSRVPREVEPSLLHAAELFQACPPSMQPLLADVLAMRAYKAACVMASWGRWQEANKLRQQFAAQATPGLPNQTLARILTTLPGSWLARGARIARGWIGQ